jgi:hypothetical protein
MQSKFMFFDKQFYSKEPYFRLIIIIFVAAVLAKGSVIFGGYAIDDYVLSRGALDLGLFFSQGRYIAAAIVWFVESIGANINDMYFSLGIVTLFLQSVFVVSILRFVGVENSPAAGLVGAIMVAHPYLTEILTFRMALPYYSVSLILSIIALEMVTRRPLTWGARAIALLATFGMLFTYQVFLNYFAVAIIFTFIYGQVLHHKNDQSLAINNIHRERALTLTIISAVSAIAFVLIIWLTKALGLNRMTGRSNFITFDEIPERIAQISSALGRIYWSAEPVFSGWLKSLVALMLVMSIVIIFRHLIIGKWNNFIINVLLIFIALILLAPVSLGVIIPFKDWWAVPRVIAHVAMIIGLIFLVADSCIQDSGNRFLKSIIFISRIVVLAGFVILSNQILADQQRINQWDKMMANRIISRLEMHRDFGNVKFVYISQSSWGFPAKFRTAQGDMNISAFYPGYSRVPLLSEVSGYRLVGAVGSKAALGEEYCKAKQPWPHAESITVDDDVAIVCLKK